MKDYHYLLVHQKQRISKKIGDSELQIRLGRECGVGDFKIKLTLQSMDHLNLYNSVIIQRLKAGVDNALKQITFNRCEPYPDIAKANLKM